MFLVLPSRTIARAEGVFGDGFDGDGDLQEVVFSNPRGDDDVRDLRFPPGQGPRFIKDDHRELVGLFETFSPLIRIPRSAPRPVPTMTAVGVARPRAQGQAMTRTETKLRRARLKFRSGTKKYQTTKVAIPIAKTTGTKTDAT